MVNLTLPYSEKFFFLHSVLLGIVAVEKDVFTFYLIAILSLISSAYIYSFSREITDESQRLLLDRSRELLISQRGRLPFSRIMYITGFFGLIYLSSIPISLYLAYELISVVSGGKELLVILLAISEIASVLSIIFTVFLSPKDQESVFENVDFTEYFDGTYLKIIEIFLD